MNQSEYQNLNTKRWRALTYNWEILSTYGNTQRLYCLTDFQVGWLLSNTEYLRWSTRWENCPCTQSDLDDMKAEMEYALMECVDLYGGLQYLIDTTQQAQFATYEALYDDGGIAGLNPNTPEDYYDGDGSDDRITALCMACDTYVRSYLDSWLAKARAAQTALVFSGVIVSFVPYIGRIAALALKGLALLTQTAVNAVSDDTAVQSVVCCMYNYLIGSAVNQANFEDCLNGCGFVGGSNASIVRDLVAADLDGFQNWLSFLNALGNSYLWITAGVEYTCPCVPETITISALQLTETLLPAVVVNGTYNSGTFAVDGQNISGSTLGSRVYLSIPVGAELVRATMTYNVRSNDSDRQNRILDGADGTGVLLADATPSAGVNHTGLTLEFTGSHVMVNDRVQFSVNANIFAGSYCNLLTIEIEYYAP